MSDKTAIFESDNTESPIQTIRQTMSVSLSDDGTAQVSFATNRGKGSGAQVLAVDDFAEVVSTLQGYADAGIEEREDGSLAFWHGAHALLATAFPREHGVQQGTVVESKRLSETLQIIKTRQRARVDATIAKPTTTLRRARLLRAGVPRRPSTDASAEDGR